MCVACSTEGQRKLYSEEVISEPTLNGFCQIKMERGQGPGLVNSKWKSHGSRVSELRVLKYFLSFK